MRGALDRLMVKLETAIAGEDLRKAHVVTLVIEELHEEQGIELAHEYFFLKAGLYLNVRDHLPAIQVIAGYLTLAGREAERYREALAVLNRAERKPPSRKRKPNATSRRRRGARNRAGRHGNES